jgi:hypothetical protein
MVVLTLKGDFPSESWRILCDIVFDTKNARDVSWERVLVLRYTTNDLIDCSITVTQLKC